MLLPDTDIDSALRSVKRFRQAIVAIDTLARPISSSFGVTGFQPDAAPLTDFKALSTRLLEQTDKALYHSKDDGKNRGSQYLPGEPGPAGAGSA